MPNLKPIYTADNSNFAFQLIWGVSIFWKAEPRGANWFDELKSQCEENGIRLLRHEFSKPKVSQFLASTKPPTAPIEIVRNIKGRLGRLICDNHEHAFRKNYGLRSIGSAKRSVIERYVESQLEHHRMADARVQARLEKVQIRQTEVDLSQSQRTTHAIYWYNLHIVLEQDGFCEVREERLQDLREMLLKASRSHGHLLSRAGILANHFHLTLGCPIESSPQDIALSYMNNLAFVYGMTPILKFSAYTGTFSDYDLGAINAKNIVPRGQAPWGRMGEG